MIESDYAGDLRLLLRGSKRSLWAALLLSVLSVVLDLIAMALLPVVVKWLLSDAPIPTASIPEPLRSWVSADPGSVILLGVLSLFLVRAGVAIAVGAYLSYLAQRVRERISRRLVSGYLQMGYLDSLDHSVAESVATITGHSAHFSHAVLLPLLKLSVDLLSIATLMAFLAWLAPGPTAIIAATLGLTGLMYSVSVRQSSEKHSRRVASMETKLHEQVSQALQGSREVRIFSAHTYFSGEISRTLAWLAHSQARLGAIYWLPRSLGELVLILIAIGYMAFSVRGGQSGVVVIADLSAFAFAGMRLLPAFAQSLAGLSAVRAGRAVTSILASQLRRTERSQFRPSQALNPPAVGEAIELLELDGVRFGYANNRPPVLDGVQFSLRRGQSIGLIGRSGAGKSTLGDILLGLLQPQAGTIRVNGREQVLDGQAWWNRVGFVPQNPFIANDSLASNIAYGLPRDQIDMQRLQESIRAAQMEDLVLSWPLGIDTVLGDQGVRLSGGQRQRVAIARALYRQRELLVLDEATSALDQQTEQEIIQALSALQGRVTSLVIAHRLSTLETCDAIFELRQGQLHRVSKTDSAP